ncbi:hypothetical protein tpqmel_0858 [Candidatus Gastranaerophilus sp. (ex Termes propinquus)]|nr:hypothetical protein tpqmel_0858 [Candidatus Gastranaerophilus sp. (ex Termes propinquus)]
MGAAALAIQPVIDFRNKDMPDETKATSVARTVGKIIAGTLVGFTVRKGCIITMSKMAQKGLEGQSLKGLEKLKTLFTPDFSKVPEGLKNGNWDTFHGNYQKAMGTILATVAMLFTNFLVDVPISKYITKKLTPKIKGKINEDNEKALGNILLYRNSIGGGNSG